MPVENQVNTLFCHSYRIPKVKEQAGIADCVDGLGGNHNHYLSCIQG